MTSDLFKSTGHAAASADSFASSLTLKKAVLAYLTGKYQFSEGRNGSIHIRMCLRGEETRWNTQIVCGNSTPLLLVKSVAETVSPETHRIPMEMYLNELNCDLTIGNWEMDARHGAVRFRSGIDFSGEQVSQVMVDRMINTHLATVSEQLPNFARFWREWLIDRPAKGSSTGPARAH